MARKAAFLSICLGFLPSQRSAAVFCRLCCSVTSDASIRLPLRLLVRIARELESFLESKKYGDGDRSRAETLSARLRIWNRHGHLMCLLPDA
jgi:hypothetical protein